MDTAHLQPTLDAYVPAGGRMGRWDIAGRTVEANLAKNPVGFDRQIQSIKTAAGRLCAFFLNDNDADGHDVSWIYDVDFERIADTPGLVAFAGGTRAHDMQVRLKYAGINAAIISNIEQAIGAVADEAADVTFYAVANYTAFPPLVKELDGLKGATADAVAGRAVARADGAPSLPPSVPVEPFAPVAYRLPVSRCAQSLRRRRQRYRARAPLRLARHSRARGRGPYGRDARPYRCRISS